MFAWLKEDTGMKIFVVAWLFLSPVSVAAVLGAWMVVLLALKFAIAKLEGLQPLVSDPDRKAKNEKVLASARQSADRVRQIVYGGK